MSVQNAPTVPTMFGIPLKYISLVTVRPRFSSLSPTNLNY